jgi:hypothetical protein
MIRKVGKKYRLYSRKGKNLGTFSSREAAMKHEKEVNYFKHLKEMQGAAGSGVQVAQGNAFKVKSAAVLDKNKKKKGGKTPYKVATLQETVLRQAIRTIIFNAKMEFLEQKTQNYLQEQKLRDVIRGLLTEKSTMTKYKTTGLNVAADTFQRVRRTIEDAYKDLTSNISQRQDFIKTVVAMVQRAVQQQKLMKSIEGNHEDDLDQTQLAEAEDMAGMDLGAAPVAEPAISLEPDQNDDQKSLERAKKIATDVTKRRPDTTGGSIAVPVVATIVPQILAARDTLKDPKDLKIFDLALLGGSGKIGNIEAIAAAAEKELAATLGLEGGEDETAPPAMPTTPSMPSSNTPPPPLPSI